MEDINFPTWKRYRELFLSGVRGSSILRILQYEILFETPLKGKLLDFGGGLKADYYKSISFDSYESINIDSSMEPTWVTDVGGDLPCPKEHYDTVLSMNTFEHIYDVKPILKQLYDALKPTGKFYCAVPFLYPIHAHPQDFFRPTDMWWKESLQACGFKNVKVTPILWGPFSTAHVCSGRAGPLKKLRLNMVLMMDLLYISLGRYYGKAFIKTLPCLSLGFFVEATKE